MDFFITLVNNPEDPMFDKYKRIYPNEFKTLRDALVKAHFLVNEDISLAD